MGPEFHQTDMGKRYYGATLPSLVMAINRLAQAIEEANESKNAEKSERVTYTCYEATKQGHDVEYLFSTSESVEVLAWLEGRLSWAKAHGYILWDDSDALKSNILNGEGKGGEIRVHYDGDYSYKICVRVQHGNTYKRDFKE